MTMVLPLIFWGEFQVPMSYTETYCSVRPTLKSKQPPCYCEQVLSVNPTLRQIYIVISIVLHIPFL